ncbi:MFS transporter [Pasteurellaceae bacterium Macca]|nr:MFS transporter [Pasteurellaceae bacterium Macca]
MPTLTPFQWSSFNFFGFYCAYGVLVPFLPVWLQHHGYQTDFIGILIALGYLFRCFGAIFFSKFVRHSNQLIPLNRLLTWASVLMVIMVATGVASPWLLVPAIGLFHVCNGGAMPIADTIASTWQQQIGLDYGKSRLFGSLAFVLGSISTGYLVAYWGNNSIIVILILWLVLLGLGLSLPPRQLFQQDSQVQKTTSISYWQLLKSPTTLKMLLAVSLIQSSHATYYAYSSLYWASEQISTQQISWLWGLAVAAEIAFFFFSKKWFKAWRISHLIIISALVSALRWGLMTFNNEFLPLAFIQLLHAMTYGMGHYAMVRYISAQPVEHIAKLQALYFSSAGCIMMALFTFIGGAIYEVSAITSFAVMALVALPAIWLVPKKLPVQV